MFPSSPTCFSSSSPPGSESSFCDMPCFRAHQPAPPSSSPPGSESLFATCHISKLTNPPLPHFLPSSKCDGPTNGPLDQERETKRSRRWKGKRGLGQGYDNTGALTRVG